MSIESLIGNEGKNVTVTTKRGEGYTGNITSVSGGIVHLEIYRTVNGVQRKSTKPLYIKKLADVKYN